MINNEEINHILSLRERNRECQLANIDSPHPHGWACDLVPHKDMNKNSKVIVQLFKW